MQGKVLNGRARPQATTLPRLSFTHTSIPRITIFCYSTLNTAHSSPRIRSRSHIPNRIALASSPCAASLPGWELLVSCLSALVMLHMWTSLARAHHCAHAVGCPPFLLLHLCERQLLPIIVLDYTLSHHARSPAAALPLIKRLPAKVAILVEVLCRRPRGDFFAQRGPLLELGTEAKPSRIERERVCII